MSVRNLQLEAGLTPSSAANVSALREAAARTLMPAACATLYSRLAAALVEAGDLVEAWHAEFAATALSSRSMPVLSITSHMLAADPERYQRWLAAAKLALRRGNASSALLALHEANALGGGSPSARLILGKALHANGFPGAALHVLQQVLDDPSKAPLAEAVIEQILIGVSAADAAPAAALLVERWPGNGVFAALAARSDVEPFTGAAAASALEAAAADGERAWPLLALAEIQGRDGNAAAEAACLKRATAVLPVAAGDDLVRTAIRLNELGCDAAAERTLLRAMIGKPNSAARDILIRRMQRTPRRGGHLANLPLVLVSQIQRSGGTLLSQLFDGHPELFSHPHEVQIGWPEKWHWPEIKLEDPPEVWLDLLLESRLAKFAQLGYRKADGNALSTDTLSFDLNVVALGERFFGLVADTPPRSPREVVAAYFTAYFESWPSYPRTGRERWFCGFVPRMISVAGSVAAFRDTYPDGLLVSCIRSPLSWYASARRHDEEYRSVEHATELWKTSVLSAVNLFLRAPASIHLLTYDGLVTEPKSEMRRLADRLGIAFDPCLLSPTYIGQPIRPNSSYAIAESVIHTHSLNGAERLTPAEHSYLEREAMPLYRDVVQMIEVERTSGPA